jgi:chromosome partitioning protein
MSKRIAMFNHKGGVSKTTSAYNIGWMLSRESNVLLVDADPQCNLSSLLLGDDFERYYLEEATQSHNIKDGVKVAFEGKPFQITPVDCFSPTRAPSLYLLAGHANLSEYDAALSLAQNSSGAFATLQNLPGAFSELFRLTEERYNIDYTIIDMNPSLSAINQNLFVSSHAFVVPTNPDPFSLMAVHTLKDVLPKWVAWSKGAAPQSAGSAYPMPGLEPKFLGTLIQRFNIRRGRAARPYRDNIAEIKGLIGGEFFSRISAFNMTLPLDRYPQGLVNDRYCLAEIPDFQGLLPKAYDVGVPVFALENHEINEAGLVLNQMVGKRDDFHDQFLRLSETLEEILQYV